MRFDRSMTVLSERIDDPLVVHATHVNFDNSIKVPMCLSDYPGGPLTLEMILPCQVPRPLD
jgi:hypothetical protein